jgi:hypothetical protein
MTDDTRVDLRDDIEFQKALDCMRRNCTSIERVEFYDEVQRRFCRDNVAARQGVIPVRQGPASVPEPPSGSGRTSAERQKAYRDRRKQAQDIIRKVQTKEA